MTEEIITSAAGDELIASESVTDLITESGEVVVLDEGFSDQVLEEAIQDPLVEDSQVMTVLSTGLRFIATASEEDMAYDKRTDFVGDDVIYKAEAAPGTLDSEPLWRIRKITIAVDGDLVEKWANGDAGFSNVWNDHLSLSY